MEPVSACYARRTHLSRTQGSRTHLSLSLGSRSTDRSIDTSTDNTADLSTLEPCALLDGEDRADHGRVGDPLDRQLRPVIARAQVPVDQAVLPQRIGAGSHEAIELDPLRGEGCLLYTSPSPRDS